jgi:manganese transport protein
MGIDTSRALVLSQVVLSLAVPVPMPRFSGSRRAMMGDGANGKALMALALVVALLVLSLDAVLLVQAL